MKWLNFTITKLTFSIILGILIAYYNEISWVTSCLIFCGLFLTSFVFFWIARKQFIQTVYFGIVALLTTISLGMVIENFHEEKNHASHYSHIDTIESTEFRIHEVLKSNSYYHKYIGEVLRANDAAASGKILVHIRKDSLTKTFPVDTVLYTKQSLSTVTSALNPTSFDYKAYLNDRYVYMQLYLKTGEFIHGTNPPKTVYGYAARLRNTIHNRLVAANFQTDELAVIEALLLGQRQHISKELHNNYANAGAIHILAISGLHVGILMLIIQFVLRPLQRFRYGKSLKVVLMLAILWSFAFVSGLSASVVRAVTMFTAIVVATYFRRQANTLQVLTVSMFFLLLCKPHFLFDVGFQLSYAAVFSIVCLQPLWKKLWNPTSFLGSSFWGLLTVSLSAQLGVLPLSLYYFHQFPGLFFVANLTIIPVLGIILTLGMLVIVLAYFQLLPEFLSICFNDIILLMNGFVSWIASHEQFVLTNIPMRFLQMIGCYIVLIAFAQYIHLPKRKNLQFALLSILLCQGCWFLDRFQEFPTKNTFAIFHQNKATILAKQQGTNVQLFHNLNDSAAAKNYNIQFQKQKDFIDRVTQDSLQNVYAINDSYLLRIDSLGIYQIPNLKPKYILLSNSPKINFDRLIQTLQPENIIADGSNYKSYIKRWKKASEKQKIPFHYTGKKGFFSISFF
ncbi:ComEC/Rec2 family competence protein [Kordia sp.]|uniref:ComEC/Rec2 family competence protein n=1 Tax=Kordia sp. TaxID=1965332 RepID=UPI0025C27276|nr:ComEC/Rec2 family competence protein [Kordia sp.]MCH2196887.1 ComEC family competence protein [Kordia sp.]